ncbi:MAG: ABC transporter substrate-binding protein [Patescibacteria group bacterium]
MFFSSLKTFALAAVLVASSVDKPEDSPLKITEFLCSELIDISDLSKEDKVTRIRPIVDRYMDAEGQASFVAGPRWQKATPEQKREFRSWLDPYLYSAVVDSVATWDVVRCSANPLVFGDKVEVTVATMKEKEDGDYAISVFTMYLVFVRASDGFRARDIVNSSGGSLLSVVKQEVQQQGTFGPMAVFVLRSPGEFGSNSGLDK